MRTCKATVLILPLLSYSPLRTAADDKVAATPCAQCGSSVVIHLEKRVLTLCQNNKAIDTFPVALGTGGIGKKKQGDGKTPIGSYTLGTPRKSYSGFHTFIPVDYPSSEQKKAGYTGGAIGIHGPPRAFRWAGAANTTINWTDGCIAVASDADIDKIAAWVTSNKIATVTLIPGKGQRAKGCEVAR